LIDGYVTANRRETALQGGSVLTKSRLYSCSGKRYEGRRRSRRRKLEKKHRRHL